MPFPGFCKILQSDRVCCYLCWYKQLQICMSMKKWWFIYVSLVLLLFEPCSLGRILQGCGYGHILMRRKTTNIYSIGVWTKASTSGCRHHITNPARAIADAVQTRQRKDGINQGELPFSDVFFFYSWKGSLIIFLGGIK